MIGWAEVEAAKKQAQVMAVGGMHGCGRVAGGEHDVIDEGGKDVELAGFRRWASGRLFCWGGLRGAGVGGQFIEDDGGGLAQIHGGLLGVGGDFDEGVAVGEVLAREAVFFGTEDDSYAGFGMDEVRRDPLVELIEADDCLFGLAMRQRAGAKDERAIADGFGESRALFC